MENIQMDKKLINNSVIIVILAILLLPIITMVLFSFVYTNGTSSELTLSGFNELFKDVRIAEVGRICYRSFIVSLLATTIAYVVSYLLVTYTSNKFQLRFLILTTLPFIANEAVRIFSWQNVLAENGLLNIAFSKLSQKDIVIFSSAQDFNIVTTMIITCIPFAIFICTATLKTIPEIYWKASNDMKLNHISRFLKVGLPLSKKAILSSVAITFFVAFALSSEVLFLGGATKVSIRGFLLSLMSANKYEAIFAFGVLVLLLLIIGYIIYLISIKARISRQV